MLRNTLRARWEEHDGNDMLGTTSWERHGVSDMIERLASEYPKGMMGMTAWTDMMGTT